MTMGSLLIHLTCGHEDPTRATLALLVARSALEDGHTTTLFLAGDAVTLLRAAVADALVGLGTGAAREHLDTLVAGGARFFASGMSSAARGVGEEDLLSTAASFATPSTLVRLALEHDRVFTY
jgi:uncharacterized protein